MYNDKMVVIVNSTIQRISLMKMTSVKNQKGVIAIQRCSNENQKGVIAFWFSTEYL